MGRAWYKKGFKKNWVPPDFLQVLCTQASKLAQGFIPSLFSQPLMPTGFYFSSRKELYSTCYYATLLLKRYVCVLLFLKWLQTSPQGFLGGTHGKEPACQCRRHKSPGLGRSPGGGHGNPLWYSCLENPMDRGAWWATVHGDKKSQTRLKQHSMHTYLSTPQIKQPV